MTLIPENRVHRLLLVEDSVSFSYWIKAKLEKEPGLEIVLARTMEEAARAIDIYKGGFFLALLDLTLPDATGDEVVQLATSNNIPSVVFTGSYSDDLRERLFALGAIDYLIKENQHSLNYAVSLIQRIRSNEKWKALVVDDSRTSRAQISATLKKYRFQVLEAEDGPEALELLDQHQDIRIVITDYNMPKMDGWELTRAIRQKHRPDQLAIIGVSSTDKASLSARFLKFGANDFLNKPFSREEFFCRVSQNMDYLDHVDALTEAAARDSLTGLHNRRHFIEVAGALASQGRRDEIEFSVAMIDIDDFKAINDNYGHQTGDQVLKHLAGLLSDTFKRGSDVFARFGGEEFCVFLYDTPQEPAELVCERFRALVEDNPLRTGGLVVPVTVSIGVCSSHELTLNQSISAADHALYAAKDEGRNCVVSAENGAAAFFNDGGANAVG